MPSGVLLLFGSFRSIYPHLTDGLPSEETPDQSCWDELSEEEDEDGGTYSGTEEEEAELLGGVTGVTGGSKAAEELSPSGGCSSGFCGVPVKSASSYTTMYPAAPLSFKARTALRSCPAVNPPQDITGIVFVSGARLKEAYTAFTNSVVSAGSSPNSVPSTAFLPAKRVRSIYGENPSASYVGVSP